MAGTLQDIATLSNDGNFRCRCMQALVNAAVNVMAEAASTTGHAQRTTYAAAVLNGGVDPYRVAMAVLSNSTIASSADATKVNQVASGGGVADGDIQFTANSLFSSLAGVPQFPAATT